MTNDPKDTERLDRLVQQGLLQPDEAESLKGAVPPRQRAPTVTPSQADNPFLRGAISESEFRARGRRTAWTLGLTFGICFGVGFPLVTIYLFGRAIPWGIAPVLALATGIPFGWAMHAFLIRPMVEKQVALRDEAGPLAPLPIVDAHQCPECRSEEFSHSTWRNGILLHWTINPVLAFNELCLGQRLPSELRTCVHCNTASVGCTHCNCAIHGMHWSGASSFGNYSGLDCPSCSQRLPTHSNAFAWLVRLPFSLVGKALGRGKTLQESTP